MAIDFLVPTLTSPAGGWTVHSLSDYFGLPTGVANLEVSALWHRAYNLIWNEWFRDENLQNSLNVPTGDGPDSNADYALRRRGKRHDYFTSALPWPQKGPGVELPLGTTAPVLTSASAKYISASPMRVIDVVSHNYPVDSGDLAFAGGTGNVRNSQASIAGSASLAPSNLYADLSQASAATINSLRQAFQLQRMYERDARGGTRILIS